MFYTTTTQGYTTTTFWVFMRYKICNGEIYFDNKPTGVKAFYTKKEIMEKYKWSRTTMRKNLNDISHKIYDDSSENYKRLFTPQEMCYIFDYFGLP